MPKPTPKKPFANSPRATIKDVAKLAKVDPSLVSRIVNNDPKASASTETRKRVLDAVAQLNYRANSAARMLKTARTQMIGLLLPDMSNPMYSSIIFGVEKRCAELNYGVLIGDHAESNSDKIFNALLERGQVDGLLIASGTLSDSFLKKEILNKHRPVIMINRRVNSLAGSVTVNDELGAYLAVDHLSLSKPKLIAGIFGPSNIDTARRRRLGFVDACANLGIKNLIVEETNWNMRAGYEAGLKLLQRKNPPDGIFVSTIMMGIGLLRAAYELNVPVPHSLQVVAMHDSDVANFLIPSLTTVHMPTIEMGSQSVDLLLRVIEGASVSHLIVDIDPYLVVRQSSTKA